MITLCFPFPKNKFIKKRFYIQFVFILESKL